MVRVDKFLERTQCRVVRDSPVGELSGGTSGRAGTVCDHDPIWQLICGCAVRLPGRRLECGGLSADVWVDRRGNAGQRAA